VILQVTHYYQGPKCLQLNFSLILPLLGYSLGLEFLLFILIFELFDSLKEMSNFLGHGAFLLLLDVSKMPLINELNMIEFLSDSQQYFLFILMELRVKEEEVDDRCYFVVKSDIELMMRLALLKKSSSILVYLVSIFDELVPFFKLNLIEAKAVLLFHED